MTHMRLHTYLWLPPYFVHHSQVLMQQNVTVKQKCPRNRRVPEIHPHLDAVERTLAFPVRNFDGIPQVVIRHWLSVHFQNHEMNLVDVERMGLERSIFDRPILHRSHFRRDDRLLVALEHFLFLTIQRYIKLDGTVDAAKLLRKIDLALCRRSLFTPAR